MWFGLVNKFFKQYSNGKLSYEFIFVNKWIRLPEPLTAYKVQEIKRIGEGLDENGNEIALADSKKLALMGALSLYITFINLFLSLLRVFGDRR